ncbi:MAG: hypothetical protein J7M08_01635 [Planctomycetes bacterium]|nr:hypothetical protein [Planctomycetota bacterium]
MEGSSRRFSLPGAAVSLLAAMLLLASGCNIPRPIKTYEYITNYERMTDRYEPLVSLVYVPEDLRLAYYDAIMVGDFDPGDYLGANRDKALGYAALFRVVLRRELRKLQCFDVTVLDGRDLPDQPGDVLRISGKLTRFKTGSGLGRYLSGLLPFLQCGATDFQVEGRIVDERSHAVLMEFVDRRRGIYNTPFGPNPHTLRERFAITLTVKDTAASIVAFLRRQSDFLPATTARPYAASGG